LPPRSGIGPSPQSSSGSDHLFLLFALLQVFLLTLFCAQSLGRVFNLTLSVKEGLPAKTIVGDLGAVLSAPSTGFFISESRDSYVFRDLEIDADTGIISTVAGLDRESRDRYEFVAATLTGEMIRVRIEVEDVNDHSPVFPRKEVELGISELCPPGSRFPLEGAADRDEEEFSTRGYRIRESEMEELFHLDFRIGSEKQHSLDLVLNSRVDRETQDFYTLTIEAFDGGIPARTGTVQVDIRILDENDNPPVFNQSEYHSSVREDAPIGFIVSQVLASDRDLGDNSRITYEINRRQSDPNHVFSINETTGFIYLNKPLDFEIQPFHELIVRARDDGAQPEYSSTFVGVKVLNINDNSPTISVLFLSETGEAVVSEAAAVGEYVARISVSDPDLEERGISVSLEGGDGKFTLKQTDDFLYALCVNSELDREEKDLYELTVQASDSGSPPLSSETLLLLKVSDANDCQPVFEQDVYTVNIAEDAPEGSSLIRTRARDADEGVNSNIRYSILKSHQDGLVAIDPTSGLVTTAAGLDRETQMEVWFLVLAEDGGEPSLSSTATVTVLVEDVNDNEPVFQQQLYNVSIPEHMDTGSCFIQVVATDADSPEFGALLYSLSDGFDSQESHPLFQIDPHTGELCVSQDIDRDDGTSVHDILIKAEDPGGLSAQTYVHIEIQDLNDNAPVFSPEEYTVSVSSHAPPGTEVVNVIATDQDSGRFGQVTYEIHPGDMSSLFTLDTHTGGLYLYFKTVKLYFITSMKLLITAQDGDGLSSARPAEVTINVVQSAEAPAVFLRSRYAFTVPEDAPLGTSVGTVEASNSTEPISYRISSGNLHSWFSVHPKSGVINTIKPLDHESQPYALLFLQSYTDTSPIYSTTQVNITITDVNDNAPVFPKRRDTITVSRSTRPGTVLFIAHAHDHDSGANGIVQYHLKSSRSEVFAIDSNLGMVRLNKSLHVSQQQRYNLEILAKDEGKPPLSSTLTLSVNIDHTAADDSLAFETLVYQVEIGEGYRKDSRVIQVRAHRTRGSHTSNSGLTYSLEAEAGFPPPPFHIHPKSGWLYLSSNLDFETESRYRFQVLSTCGEASLANVTATAMVNVLVLDVNDNPPVFSSDVYYFTVSEGSSPQGLVGTVRAKDKDSGKNSQLSYILLSDGKYFRINAKTGEIINWVALDREQHSQHSLTVMVTDQGHPRLNATANVHVLVTDINDNTPQFNHLPSSKELNVYGLEDEYGSSDHQAVRHFSVREDAEPATVIGSVSVSDEGRFQYSIAEGDGSIFFGIDGTSGDIYVNQPLDYESAKQYFLVARVEDVGASVGLNISVLVSVTVEDVNDHAPWFPNKLLMFGLREDAAVGSLAFAFHARDTDGTFANSALRYTLTFDPEVSGSTPHFPFHMNSHTGAMTVAAPLDRESTPTFVFTVAATDQAERMDERKQTSVMVRLLLLDVNDNRPVFVSAHSVQLMEDTEVGSLLHHFVAIDGDQGENGLISYSIINGNKKGFFSLEEKTGLLFLSAPLDYETQRVHRLTVRAADQGIPSLSSTQTLTVEVGDVNDQTPVFSQTTYVTSVVENKGPGEPLLRVSASDMDSVQARDNGFRPLLGTATVLCSILDDNDNPPEFMQPLFQISLPENLSPGVIHTALASDSDLGENGTIHYSVLGEDYGGRFAINSETGAVSIMQALDREEIQNYTLTIQAQDSGPAPLSSTTQLLILLLDQNDNAPSFSPESYHASVSEGLPPGAEVLQLTAFDPDEGPNGEVTYTLTDDNSQGAFSVDPFTGVVRTTRSLDRESQALYTLKAVATDGSAQGPLSSVASLTIEVDDVNDNVPVCDQNPLHAWVSIRTQPNQIVTTAVATDADQGENGMVQFRFSGEESLFDINSASGEISLRRRVRAGFSGRKLEVLVSDRGRPPQTATCLLLVHLKGEHDGLQFTNKVYNATVKENSRAGTWITKVEASDDTNGRQRITYTIFSGNENAAFSINRYTGEIRVQKENSLDFEVSPQIQLVVLADSGLHTAHCRVSVTLLDVNDNAPLFELNPVVVGLFSDSYCFLYFKQVFASDADSSENGQIEYSILSGNINEAFILDSVRGILATNVLLDREITPSYSLDRETVDVHGKLPEVAAHPRPAGNNRNSLHVTFLMHVHLCCLVSADTLVVNVAATDRDSGLNGKISYRLLSSPLHAFYIQKDNGSIFTNKPLRTITYSNMLHLLVEARDEGEPVRSTVTSVALVLVDANDHKPLFHQDVYTLTTAEDTPPETTLLTISAQDEDWSPENTHLDYAIIGGNEEKRFCLEVKKIPVENQMKNVGRLVLCNPLDRETTEYYELTVSVSDRGTPPLNSSSIIKVTVTDCNDNAPVFSSAEYHAEVSESSQIGTSLVHVSALDPDLGVNGLVHYEIISGNSKGHLKLDPQSGILMVNQSLDYEEDLRYILTIRATDGGQASENQNMAFAVVFVNVLDENDNTPFFMFPSVTCSVLENLPAFTHTCSVHAVDKDSGPYGLLTYSILSSCFMDYGSGSPERKEAFAIDALTGDIHTRQTFDYERENEYCFVVEAKDKGDKSATVRVQVAIKGVDEFSPIFTQKQYHFLLPENPNTGKTVGFVMAMDHDGGVDGLVEYSLLTPSPFFSINKTIGAIFVSGPVYRRRISHASEDMVELVVTAGSPRLGSRTTTCLVFVNISSSAEALTGVQHDSHIFSLSLSLLLFVFVLVIFVGLVLRCKVKEAVLKKASAIAAQLNHGTDSSGESNSQMHSDVSLQELTQVEGFVAKRDVSNPYTQSDSSGRGSAEGETAEDQEIKWINEFPCYKREKVNKLTTEIPNSTLPVDKSSCHSIDVGPEHILSLTKCLAQGIASTESLNHFQEEGGGEELLPAILRVKDLEDSMGARGYAPLSKAQASADSLTSLVCLEEPLEGSYSWDFLLDWEPRFHSLAAVFTDIGMLPDEELQGGHEDFATESSSLMYPPPLITGVAQPGIRTVPPRKPGRVPTLSRKPSYPKYAYSPLARNTGLTPSAMTPTFTPSLSSLTMRTPSSSPVVSDTGVGGIRLDSGPHTASLLEAEIQVPDTELQAFRYYSSS
uniref:Protocadherin-16 n=1 Tax=Poecilia latipinna TaxID=48699 RepID=A0A3B3W2B7_9TELE